MYSKYTPNVLLFSIWDGFQEKPQLRSVTLGHAALVSSNLQKEKNTFLFKNLVCWMPKEMHHRGDFRIPPLLVNNEWIILTSSTPSTSSFRCPGTGAHLPKRSCCWRLPQGCALRCAFRCVLISPFHYLCTWFSQRSRNTLPQLWLWSRLYHVASLFCWVRSRNSSKSCRRVASWRSRCAFRLWVDTLSPWSLQKASKSPTWYLYRASVSRTKPRTNLAGSRCFVAYKFWIVNNCE